MSGFTQVHVSGIPPDVTDEDFCATISMLLNTTCSQQDLDPIACATEFEESAADVEGVALFRQRRRVVRE